MEKDYTFDEFDDNELFKDELEELLEEQNSYSKERDGYLTEIDFYPPSDNRTWKSNVEDINGGDNFADYCEYIFRLYEKEDCYEN